jgi:hypothetical protein
MATTITPGAIDPADEGMHEPTAEPQFNESMYFNFVDQAGDGFATLIRMGNRVNEGHAEVTVLVYLPDGSAAVHIERAPISDNSKFDAGGLRFDVLEPLQKARVRYDGDAHKLARGIDLLDPKAAFTTSPLVPMSLDLEFTTIARLFGLGGGETGEGGIEGAEDTIATGHYQGGVLCRGTITIDGESRTVDATGFRDHSWGPRKWTAPRWWRWISAWIDDRNGFSVWSTKVGDTQQPGNGAVLHDGKLSLIRRVDVKSTYGDAPYHPQTVKATLTTDERTFELTCRTLPNVIPLRHRREGYHARIAELLGRFEFEGMTGYGFLEYHDLLVDGVPAGLEEA